jgi:hypothetical protein
VFQELKNTDKAPLGKEKKGVHFNGPNVFGIDLQPINR